MDGTVVAMVQQPAGAGLRRAVWNLRSQPAGGRGGRGGGGAPVPPGRYTVSITAGDLNASTTATVQVPVALPRISGPNPRR
jgi:hypothetical protein